MRGFRFYYFLPKKLLAFHQNYFSIAGGEEKAVNENDCGGCDKKGKGMSTKMSPWGKGVSGRMCFIFLCKKIIDILFQLL